MLLKEKIDKDFKEALRNKDQRRLSCLRMLKSAIKNREKDLRRELKEEEIISVISSLVKRGRDSIEEFKKGGREDLIQKEQEELNILYEYLPKQLSPEQIEKELKEIILQVGAKGPKDLGKVMKVAMKKMAGKAQGKEVNEIARRLLS